MGVGGSRISLLAPVRAYAAAAFAADFAARQRDVHPGVARRLDRPGGGGRPRPCYAAPPVDHQRSCQPSAAPLGALTMFQRAGGQFWRAPRGERVCRYVSIYVYAVT